MEQSIVSPLPSDPQYVLAEATDRLGFELCAVFPLRQETACAPQAPDARNTMQAPRAQRVSRLFFRLSHTQLKYLPRVRRLQVPSHPAGRKIARLADRTARRKRAKCARQFL